VGRRFIEHSSGLHEDSYTYKRRPLKLVYCKQFEKPMEAINYEKQLKRWTRSKKEALIKYDYKNLHELSKCKNETSHLKFKGSG
jgi:putative endonuclease